MASLIFLISLIVSGWGAAMGKHCDIHLKPNTGVFYADAGEIVSVTCDLSCFGVQRAHGIEWKSPEGSTISNTTGRIFTAPYHRGKKIKLFLTNVTSVDAGSYSCGGEINGDHQLVSFMLVVSDPRLGSVYPIIEDVGFRNALSGEEFIREIRTHRSILRNSHPVNIPRQKHKFRRAISTTQTTATSTTYDFKSSDTTHQQTTITVGSTAITAPLPSVNVNTNGSSTSPGTTLYPTVNTTRPTASPTTSDAHTTISTQQPADLTTTLPVKETTKSRTVSTELIKPTKAPVVIDITSPVGVETILPKTARVDTSSTQITHRTQTDTPKQSKVTVTVTDPVVSTEKSREHHASQNTNDKHSNSFWGTNGLAAFVIVLLIAIILLIALIIVIVLPRWTRRKQTLHLRPKENRLSRGNTSSVNYTNYKNEKLNPILTADSGELTIRSSASNIVNDVESEKMTKNASFTVIDLDDDVNESPNYGENETEEKNGEFTDRRESNPSNTSLSSLLESAGLTREENKVDDDEKSSSDNKSDTGHVETKSVDTAGAEAYHTCDDDSNASVHSDKEEKDTDVSEGVHIYCHVHKPSDGRSETNESAESSDGTKETDVMLVSEG